MIALTSTNITNRSAAGLNAIRQGLGGEYAKLAVPGLGIAKLPSNTAHRVIVARLQEVGFAGKIAANPSPTGKMIVNRKQTTGSFQ